MSGQVKIADPGPLGLAGFGITTCILSLINAGVESAGALGVVLGLAIAYGGTAQFIAGLWEFRKGNTFGATAFCSYGAFWWAFYLINKFAPTAGLGLFLLFFGILTLFLWFGTFYLNKALWFVFLTLWITFFLLAAHAFGIIGSSSAGGWVGFICGLSALYTSFATVLNETMGHVFMPVGQPFAQKRPSSAGVSA
ncbi:acetate uptake transporter [Alicyclobacillus mali]|uniref:Acetate uptake transporter n=1 Tax=Alicyclobacillus mali (ex Roth et al. 2021) TaxID=1123961 RepID=A0ABS0F2P1_9BACL|nr:GPR1/FUN34/YaaH family transporter [Alicyclobacillus mali (ex Roth et al. 2021)]MBF8377542.1 acetate uptake transporter [Alicyclobacillus mali (ex Roth et al. 2021)]MCL6487504.1 acetate uptake transporter [Alicyclobacillus mali (ex Roth et al. 2021)]